MTLPSSTRSPHTRPPGKIIFVGAGPGNPDLLTVRAREVMETNSIALVDPDVAQGARDVVAAKLPVPKAKMQAADEAYARMVAEAKEAGARRKPPRPDDPTAAEVEELALSADTMPAPQEPDPHFVAPGGRLRDRFPAAGGCRPGSPRRSWTSTRRSSSAPA